MTNRPIDRDAQSEPIAADVTANSEFKGNDYYRISTVAIESEVAPMPVRLSQSRLQELNDSITQKDRRILHSLMNCRYLMTKQIQRLHYYDSATPTAGAVATMRALRKLKANGLLNSFDRRIGGVRAGSASYVWHLTEGGLRLLNLNTINLEENSRKRFLEPTYPFMRHTLAIAECYVNIVELCRNNNSLSLKEVQFEPECWRQYIDAGKRISLNPDLFVITESGEYEDRWFIEIDLSTESPSTVICKCQRYHQYYGTGREQKVNEVFPVTLWVVPDLKRKNVLEEKIRNEFKKQVKLFRVITMDELGDLMINGCEPEMLY